MAPDPVRRVKERCRPLVLVALAALGLAVAGCDKCGHAVHFNAPSIQKACADDTPTAR